MPDFRTKSFWLSTAAYTPAPPLTGPLDVDVAVVGGGFTGLSTALHLREAAAAPSVAVLEADAVGSGASGRNAGFAMTLFGLTLGVTKLRFGAGRAREAHRYMERAVDYTGALVERLGIECEYERPGFLRVATRPAYVGRLLREIELAHALGLRGIEWIDRAALAERVRSPHYLGAWWEPRCALVNPAKLAWGLRRAAAARGARFYEGTPVLEVERAPGGVTLRTPGGAVRARQVVLATNAWSHLVAPIRRKQVPAFTHVVLTEPIPEERRAEIGWRGREGIEDARNLVHYYRLTRDDRLLLGGGAVSLAFGHDMERDLAPATFRDLEEHAVNVFPALAGLRVTHRWGGPVSVPLDLAPAIGTVDGSRVVWSLGCVGHGVSLTQLNGRTVADLVLGRRTEDTEVFFVRRRTIPWPPEPLRAAVSHLIRGALVAEDAWTDRGFADAALADSVEVDDEPPPRRAAR